MSNFRITRTSDFPDIWFAYHIFVDGQGIFQKNSYLTLAPVIQESKP